MTETNEKYRATEEFVDEMMREEFDTWQITEISERLTNIQMYAEAQLSELDDTLKGSGLRADDVDALPVRAKAATLARVLRGRIKACKALLNEPWG